MKKQAQTVFLIEGLQPGWLESLRLRWIYLFGSRIGLTLAGGPIAGLILGLSSDLLRGATDGIRPGVIIGLFGSLLVGVVASLMAIGSMGGRSETFRTQQVFDLWKSTLYLFVVVAIVWIIFTGFGLILGLSNWLDKGFDFWWAEGFFGGLLAAISVGFFFFLSHNRHFLTGDIQTVENLRWSPQKALKGGAYGAIWGIAIGGFIMSMSELTGYIHPLAQPVYNAGANVVLIMLLAWALIIGLGGLLFGGLEGSFQPAKARPNQGIRLSLKNSLILGLVGVGMGTVFLGFLMFLLQANRRELLANSLLGSFWGILAFLWYGGFDIVKHYSLRLILWRTNALPWNYAAFLDYAAERIFLRKVGGGYIFVHRLLLEYFAELEPAQTEKK